MENHHFTVILAFVLIICSSFTLFGSTFQPATGEPQHSISTNGVLTPGSFISINGNNQFSSIASSGNGTKLNPYIIKDLIISSFDSNGYGVDIENTNAYFILQNITVNSQNNNDNGFYFSNVINGLVTNNTANGYNLNSLVNYYGFKLVSCNNSIFSHNYIFKSQDGFFIQSSSNNTFEFNAMPSLSLDGFFVNVSTKNFFYSNSISNNENSFELRSSNNNTFKNNLMANDWNDGVLVTSSNFNDFLLNNISWDFNEIEFSKSNNNTIRSNVMFGGLNYGIALSSSSDSNIVMNNSINVFGLSIVNVSYSNFNVFKNNTIIDNFDYYGVYMSHVNYTVFTNNEVAGNTYGLNFEYSNFNSLSGNNISINTNYGLYLFQSVNNSLHNNTFKDNIGNAIELSTTSNNTITQNLLIDNYGYGIFINNSLNDNVYFNGFIYNNGLHTQAFINNSSGFSNPFYTIFKNYWSDYSGTNSSSNPLLGTTAYPLTGSGVNTVDPTPLVIIPFPIVPIIYFYAQSINVTAGSTGNILTWQIITDNSSTFSITRNNTLVESGNPTYDKNISLNIDGLNPGLYVYTLTISDQSGKSNAVSVNVMVPQTSTSSSPKISSSTKSSISTSSSTSSPTSTIHSSSLGIPELFVLSLCGLFIVSLKRRKRT